MFFLNITSTDGNCDLQAHVSEQKKTVFSAPEDFSGESLSYGMSFWFFSNAAKGRITCTKHEKGYIAVLEAETCGFTRLITGHKKEIMKSIMEYDRARGKFRPLMFQELFFNGNKERKKTISFDYKKTTYTVSWGGTERKTTTITRKLPKKEFDDLLTFFYNFRMGYYGDVQEGKTISIYVLVTLKPSYVSVTLGNKNKTKNRPGKYYATVSMERTISETRSKIISGWFSHDFIPLECVIEDAYFFGDINIKLKERKYIKTDMVLD